MGGGTILILILNNFLNYNLYISQAANLVFFVPTSISAIIINSKQKLIDFKLSIKVILSGIPGVFIGICIMKNIDETFLKKCFAVFLILIAIYEIYTVIKEYRISKKRNNK